MLMLLPPLTHNTGIRHRGCWYLNTRTGRLGTLEGLTPDLMDDPFTRDQPVSKCGVAAQTLNFNLFGVTLGYCISGSNLLSDYQYVSSQLCRDGIGGYNRNYGLFVMDVYEITSSQLFQDSANGVTESMTTTEEMMVETTTEEEMDINGGEPEERDGDSGAVGVGATWSVVVILLASLLSQLI